MICRSLSRWWLDMLLRVSIWVSGFFPHIQALFFLLNEWVSQIFTSCSFLLAQAQRSLLRLSQGPRASITCWKLYTSSILIMFWKTLFMRWKCPSGVSDGTWIWLLQFGRMSRLVVPASKEAMFVKPYQVCRQEANRLSNVHYLASCRTEIWGAFWTQ